MSKLSCAFCSLLLTVSAAATPFATDGNGVRTVVAAQVAGGPALYLSELDGAVSCYRPDGTKLWRTPTQEPAVLFGVRAVDVDGDGSDELVGAGGDGHVTCWGDDGSVRWRVNPGHKVLFTDLAVMKTDTGVRVFAGGNDGVLYELDGAGEIVSKTPIKGVVRKIEVGDFLKDGHPTLFLMTYTHDKFRWEFLGLLDPLTKKVLKQISSKDKGVPKELTKAMVTDIAVSDLDADGRDDVLFFGDASQAVFVALNGELKEIAKFVGPREQFQRYAHATGASLQPHRPEVVVQYGGLFYLCDTSGKQLAEGGTKYGGVVFQDLVVEPVSGHLIAAGDVAGGNGVYAFDPSAPGWLNGVAPEQLGRAAEVRENLASLYRQVLAFTPPDYQPRSEKPWVMITSEALNPEVERLKAVDMVMPRQLSMQEKTDRKELVAAIGKAALKKDKRKQYDMTRAEIVALAREREAAGEPFTAWTGHGNDPFITTLETMEAVLEAAPTTCYGFLYAEMHNTDDPRVQHFAAQYVPRLAKAMRKHGRAKLYFRYKNMFWGGTVHEPLWKKLFLSGEYADILVPAAEDTSSRTQDVNFSGRVGMFASGAVDDFGMRLVDDNPTSWRPLTPGGQRSASPYVRNGVAMAAHGARFGINLRNRFLEEPGLGLLYAIMRSGVLPVVEPEDLASVGSWLLVEDIDEDHMHRIDDHHKMKQYTPGDTDAVFSVAHMHWAGTSLPAHDYSRVALGAAYRWMNYLPPMPRGMVPVGAVEFAPVLEKAGVPFAVTNGVVGRVDGQDVPAAAFGDHLDRTVAAGGAKLPVLVDGASWSAIRLDDTHLRVVLIDPGYLDPRDRDVAVRFQNRTPVSATDILSGEALPIVDGGLRLTVPAGSMRFVDVAY